MTTFADLRQGSATAVANTSIKFGAAAHAKLKAISHTTFTSTQISGGVHYRDGISTITSTSGVFIIATRLQGAAATLGALTAVSEPQGASVALSPLTALSSDHPYADVRVAFLPLLSLSNDPVSPPTYAIVVSSMAPISSAAHSLTGTIGEGSATLMGLATLSSDHPYAGSYLPLGLLPYFVTLSGDGPGLLEAVWTEVLVTYLGWNITSEVHSDVRDTITAGGTVTAVRLADMTIYDSMVVSQPFSTQMETGFTIREQLIAVSALTREGHLETWVVNANTNASSQYDNFDFNSLAKWQDKYLAANDDGVFILTGNDDDGEPIEATIVTANSDFGSEHKKRVPYVYLGVKSETALVIQVFTDSGQINSYTVPAQDILQNSRAEIGKGLSSRYWQFLIKNTGGGDFTIEAAELLAALSQRRI